MNKARMLSLAGVTALSFLTAGCSGDIHDQVVGGSALLGEPKVGALSTTASYRTVVAKFDQDSRVCPEPPPDVAVAVTAALTAGLSLESSKLDAEGKAEFSRAVAENITPLLRRTAAIQFYRDARSYNCFAHMNGALTAADYKAANEAALQAATALMLKEIEKGYEPIDPQGLEGKLDDVVKALEDIKKDAADKQ